MDGLEAVIEEHLRDLADSREDRWRRDLDHLADEAARMQGQQDGVVNLPDALSAIRGRKLAGAHQGTLQFRQGSLHLDGGKLAGGEVVIDMTSLKNTDQEGDMNAKLVNHLKSDDFFSVEKHPTSTLKITKVEQTGEKATVNGELTRSASSNTRSTVPRA